MNEYSEESGYILALRAVGFEVIDFEEFGSYQGDLLVFVRLNGVYGFIIEQFGSCGGCDSFQADCKDNTPESLQAFGKQYLDAMKSYDQAFAYVSKHSDWDQEALKMKEWVQKHQYPVDFDNMLKD